MINMTKVGYKEIKNKGNYESETFWVETEIDTSDAKSILSEAERIKKIVQVAIGESCVTNEAPAK